MDKMKNLDCNQIKILINLEIIGKKKFIYIYIFLNLKIKKKKFYNMVKPLGATTTSKPNFYYIVNDIIFGVQWCFLRGKGILRDLFVLVNYLYKQCL